MAFCIAPGGASCQCPCATDQTLPGGAGPDGCENAIGGATFEPGTTGMVDVVT